MNPPAWLPNSLAVLALVVAGYAVLRTVLVRQRGRPADYEADAADAVLAIAVAAMLTRWLNPVPHTVWLVALNVAGYWFAVRLIGIARRPHTAPGDEPGGERSTALLVSTAGCAIGIYMLLAGVAPPTTSTSAAASHAMAGMAGMAVGNVASRIALPELGLVLSAALAVYAAVTLNRLSTTRTPATVTAAATTAPAEGAISVPRSVEFRRIALAVIMAYAIIASLV
jgi:hypothetical protein